MDQTQVLQLRNVFSASYINLHIIRTVLIKYIIIKYLFRIWRRRKEKTYNRTKNANFKGRWNILCAKVYYMTNRAHLKDNS